MPKLRPADVADLDIAALDAIEYSTEEFDTYAGETPPVGIELTGYVKRLWWTRTQQKANGGGNDPMLKVLWVAADNEGEYEDYNDCPFWLNAPLIGSAKFRWAPFLDVYGLTLKTLKANTYIASKEDQNGAPIERIGSWKPGEDSDAAWCRIITGQEPYNGEMQPRVKEWLMWDEDAAEGAAAEDGEGDEPELFEDEDGNLVNADGELVDEDGNVLEPEEPEEEPEPEPPARTRRSRTAAPAPARATRPSAPAKPARTAPATTRTRSAAPARAAKATAAKPTRTGRGRAAAAQDGPPF